MFPLTFYRVSLPASAPLMVVSNGFIFLMNNNLYARILVLNRDCRAQTTRACADNINLDRSHQLKKGIRSPDI